MAKLLDGTRIYGSANIDNNLIVNTMNIVPTITSSFTHANAAFLQANNANVYAFGAHVTSNAAFEQANIARIHANASFLQANQVGGAVSTANGALTTANTNMVFKTGNTMTGNLVMSGANIAFITNSNAGIYWGGSGLSFIYSPNSNVIVFGTSSNEDMRIDPNGVVTIYNGLLVSGINIALTLAQTFTHANAAFLQANNANVYAFGAHQTANSAQAHSNAAFLQANNANIYAFGAHVTANAAFGVANAAGTSANLNFAYTHANAAHVTANAAFGVANAAGTSANLNFAYTHANAAHVTANAAFVQANNANVYAFGAHITANAAFQQANVARIHANAAFTKANDAFPSTGGSITGDVSITGNLTVIGNSTVFNVSSLVINDPLIFLGNNNYSSDLVDIGFVGHYNDGANAHTGFVRDATSKEYFTFNGYTPEILANDIINIAHPSFALANINANYYKGNLISNTAIITISATISGVNIVPTLFSSFTHANAAFLQANSANIYAFGAHQTANSAQAHANAAFLQANNANIYAFGAHQTANSAQIHANAAFLQANNANIYAFGAHTTANSAQVHANAAFLQANISNNLPVQNSGVLISSRNALNFIQGGNVTITIADDSVGNRVNVTISAIGGSGGGGGGDPAAFSQANSAYNQANIAYNQANAALTNSIVFISDNAPTGIANGFLWWQSNTGSLYVRYGDGDSSQWVATQQQGLGGSASFSQPASNAIAQSPTQLLASANGMTYTSSTFATSGDATVRQYMLIGTTTNSTPTRLLHSGGNGLVPIGSNTTMQYTIDISARRTNVSNESAGWTLKGVLDSFNGIVADVGDLYEIVIARDDSNYVVDALANSTSKSLDIVVTGVNTKTIRWVAYVQTVEVSQ